MWGLRSFSIFQRFLLSLSQRDSYCPHLKEITTVPIKEVGLKFPLSIDYFNLFERLLQDEAQRQSPLDNIELALCSILQKFIHDAINALVVLIFYVIFAYISLCICCKILHPKLSNLLPPEKLDRYKQVYFHTQRYGPQTDHSCQTFDCIFSVTFLSLQWLLNGIRNNLFSSFLR